MSKHDASLRAAALRVLSGHPVTNGEYAAGTALLLALSTVGLAMVGIVLALLTRWVTG